MRRVRLPAPLVLALLLFTRFIAAQGPSNPATTAKPVLWTDPGDIRSLDLYSGPGGKEHQPEFPLEFEKEDTQGTSPKFEVRDAEGKKWTAKLGLEARPETVAARLMWAAGYAANENYFFPELKVHNMPAGLQRGQELRGQGDHVPNVRVQRHPTHYKRLAGWNWRHNPFVGTREFNGLRVMMGLIANWDLKDENNAILEDEKNPGRTIYEVSDVGTSMGTPGKSHTDKVSKGNLRVYKRTRLLAHVDKNYVDLNFPKCPPFEELFEFEWGFYFHQLRLRWIGKHIPRADAKWIGSILAQLSPQQIADAFRAAGYSPEEVAAYTQAVISRIQELNSL